MAATGGNDSVVLGYWRNYDLPPWRNGQILVTEKTAQVITNTVAVALALTLPRILVLFKLLVPPLGRFFASCRMLLFGKMRSTREAERLRLVRREFSENEETGTPEVERPAQIWLHDLDQRGRSLETGVSQSITEAHSFGDAFRRLVNDHLAQGRIQLPRRSEQSQEGFFSRMWNNLRDDMWAFTWISGFALLLFAIILGQQIIAISTASIILDSAALITNSNCGVWLSELYSHPKIYFSYPEEDESPPTPIPFSAAGIDSSMKAMTYADACYTENPIESECSYLYSPSIPFEETHNATCPFADGTCLYGDTGAFSLDTGYVDSAVLGFNHAARCEFSIKSVCSPIRPVEPYVQSQPGRAPGSQNVSYYFGRFTDFLPHPNFTRDFEFPEMTKERFRQNLFTIRDHFIESYPSGEQRDFEKIRIEFQVPNALTTIFLIRSTAYYAGPSDDPIFPAVPGPGIQSPFGQVCWNNLQRHTILACANSVSIRHPRSGAIWYPGISGDSELLTPEWANPWVADTVTLLNLSLEIPRHFPQKYSRPTSQFKVLDRRNLLTGILTSDYWKSEVRRLLSVKLARLQLDVVNIAQGLGIDLPQAENELAKRGHSEACKNIKFREQSHANISVAGLIGFLSLTMLVWLCGVEVGDEAAVALVTRSYILPAFARVFIIVGKCLTVIRNRTCSWGG